MLRSNIFPYRQKGYLTIIKTFACHSVKRFIESQGTSSIFLPLWLLLKYFSSISVGFANSQGKGHLLSAVGLASFDQDRMMYTTLRAIFENIFVNREVHDKERRDQVFDLINLERLKQLKQFFWQQVFDRFDRNRCIRHIGHLLYSITV